MALNGVKENKCFESILNRPKIKLAGTYGTSVPSDTSGAPAYQWQVNNDAITASNVAIVTLQYNSDNSQAVYDGKLFVRDVQVMSGAISANIINTDTVAHAVTINYMVLGS